MNKKTLQWVWLVGFIIISVIVLAGNITIAVLLFFYKVFAENKEVALTMWGGINILTGMIVKAWIDNPFDDAPPHNQNITQVNK